MRQVVLTRHIRPEVYGWLCFGVMCLGFVFVKVAGFGQAVVAPDLIREFGLGPSELGLLTALYLWGYAAIQIPTGVLADTLGPRRAVTVFMLVAAIGTFLFGTAAAFSVSAIGRALMGVGTGILFVCNAKMISQWFRADQFATLQGILLMVGNLGVFASAAPLALLVGAVGWRQSFVLLAAFGAAVAILVFILVHDRPGEVPSSPADAVAGAPEASALRAGALAQAARSVLLNRNIWLLAIYAFVLYGALMAVQGLWAVPYLMDIHGLTRQDASNVITLWPVGTIIASPIWGYLSDRVLGTRKWVVMAGVLLFSLPFLILTLYPSGLPLWSFYALFFWCGATNSTVAVSLTSRRMPHASRSAGSVGRTNGALLSPWSWLPSTAKTPRGACRRQSWRRNSAEGRGPGARSPVITIRSGRAASARSTALRMARRLRLGWKPAWKSESWTTTRPSRSGCAPGAGRRRATRRTAWASTSM